VRSGWTNQQRRCTDSLFLLFLPRTATPINQPTYQSRSLEGNKIGSEGAKHLAHVLKTNNMLTTLR